MYILSHPAQLIYCLRPEGLACPQNRRSEGLLIDAVRIVLGLQRKAAARLIGRALLACLYLNEVSGVELQAWHIRQLLPTLPVAYK